MPLSRLAPEPILEVRGHVRVELRIAALDRGWELAERGDPLGDKVLAERPHDVAARVASKGAPIPTGEEISAPLFAVLPDEWAVLHRRADAPHTWVEMRRGTSDELPGAFVAFLDEADPRRRPVTAAPGDVDQMIEVLLWQLAFVLDVRLEELEQRLRQAVAERDEARRIIEILEAQLDTLQFAIRDTDQKRRRSLGGAVATVVAGLLASVGALGAAVISNEGAPTPVHEEAAEPDTHRRPTIEDLMATAERVAKACRAEGAPENA